MGFDEFLIYSLITVSVSCLAIDWILGRLERLGKP